METNGTPNMEPMKSARPVQQHQSWKRWAVFVAFLAIAGYLMTTEHRNHTLLILPYLLLLACPLMMLFMHHDMSSGDSRR